MDYKEFYNEEKIRKKKKIIKSIPRYFGNFNRVSNTCR